MPSTAMRRPVRLGASSVASLPTSTKQPGPSSSSRRTVAGSLTVSATAGPGVAYAGPWAGLAPDFATVDGLREALGRLSRTAVARENAHQAVLLDRLQAQEDRTEELAATLVQRDQELEECLARLEYGERELGRMDQLLDRSEGELEQRGDELSDMQRLVEHYHAVAAGEGAGLDEVEELLERLRPQLGRL